MIDVSDHRTNVWNFCPESWGLTYVDKWERKVKPAYFNKGGMFHEGVELALKTISKTSAYTKMSVEDLRDAFKGMYGNINALIDIKAQAAIDKGGANIQEEEVEKIEDAALTAQWMVRHYLHFLAVVLEHKVIFGIELKFEDVIDGAGLDPVKNRGIIDLLLYDVFEDTIYVIDHKGSADILTAEERLTHSVQLVGYSRYVAGLIKRGEVMNVVGSQSVSVELDAKTKIRPMLRVVRNKMPKVPKILKNGSVSSAAISTLRGIYQDALDNIGQPISEKQQARLDTLPDAWHTTIEPVINAEDTMRWEVEMLVTGERMEQARNLPMYRTRNTRNCHECALRNVCKLGDDPEFIQHKEEK